MPNHTVHDQRAGSDSNFHRDDRQWQQQSTHRDNNATSSLTPVDEHDARRKSTRTTDEQRLAVVEWLEQGPHFQLLSRGTAPVQDASGKKIKKIEGFRALMRHVNAQTNAQWDVDVTRSRFESIMQTFRKAKQTIGTNNSSDAAADREECNAFCPLYDRLDALATTVRPINDAMAAEDARTAVKEPVQTLAVPKAKRVKRRHSAASTGATATTVALSASDVSHASASLLNGGDTAAAAAAEPAVASTTNQLAPLVPPVETKPLAVTGSSHSHSHNNTNSDIANASNEGSLSERVRLQELVTESQRLALQQAQLALQQRQLTLKEKELDAQTAMQKHTQRAEIASQLVGAGKSVREIREYLDLLDG